MCIGYHDSGRRARSTKHVLEPLRGGTLTRCLSQSRIFSQRRQHELPGYIPEVPLSVQYLERTRSVSVLIKDKESCITVKQPNVLFACVFALHQFWVGHAGTQWQEVKLKSRHRVGAATETIGEATGALECVLTHRPNLVAGISRGPSETSRARSESESESREWRDDGGDG